MPKRKGKGLMEKGAHMVRRKALDPGGDPYLNKQPPEDMALCKKCGAVYHEKRWYKRDELPDRLAGEPNTEAVYCPGCQKSRDKYPEGYLTMEGRFVEAHGDEIMNLIGNKEAIQSHINPLGQILEIKRFDDRIEVKTTNDKLAQRLGQIVQKAFHGDVVYKWGNDTKLTRVVWRRDEL